LRKKGDIVPENTRENRRRIIDLEKDVGELKVDVGKIEVSLVQSDKRAEERHEANRITQIEIKDLIRERAAADREDRKAKRAKEAKETAWKRSLINPQTIIILLAILLGLFGIKMSDVMLSAAPSQTLKGP